MAKSALITGAVWAPAGMAEKSPRRSVNKEAKARLERFILAEISSGFYAIATPVILSAAKNLLVGPRDGSSFGRWPQDDGLDRARNSVRRILPVVVIGSSETNSIERGYSYAASRRRTKSWSPAAAGSNPGLRTTN